MWLTKDRVIKVNFRCNKSPWIYRSPSRKTIYVAFINNADCPNCFSFSFDGHPSAFKSMIQVMTDSNKTIFGYILPGLHKSGLISTICKKSAVNHLLKSPNLQRLMVWKHFEIIFWWSQSFSLFDCSFYLAL